MWQSALVRFTDAAKVPVLAELVATDHLMPEGILPGATVVVSYYLPFIEAVEKSNVPGCEASPIWARAYCLTNEMGAELNKHLVHVVNGMGFRAAVPEGAGLFNRETLLSRWSQRHVAWLAGHGTFGINNMLISEAGCCGRYFSVVADLPAEPDAPVTEERCLYKARDACGLCARRCVAGALRTDGIFDRHRCWAMCQENEAKYPKAHVCGKCDVGLPCSFRIP